MYDFVLCSFALFFFVLFCCRLPRCMILFLYVVCSVFSSSTVNKFPRKRLLHFFFRVRNLKKRGGKRGRTGGGGGIHALSNGTVLPHYDCNVYVCSCSLFFFSCIAKKASYMAAWLCVKKLSYQIKFFWIELIWSQTRYRCTTESQLSEGYSLLFLPSLQSNGRGEGHPEKNC